METETETGNIGDQSRPNSANRASPPATPAPDPMEQDQSLMDNVVAAENEEETTKPLLEGKGKGKEKAKKEDDTTDGKKRKKKRHPRTKDGEAEGGTEESSHKNSKGKRKHRKKREKGSQDATNDVDITNNADTTLHDESAVLITVPDNNIDRNPYQPTVQYTTNGMQSTSIAISGEHETDGGKYEVELREININIIHMYTLVACVSCVFFFPVGIPAILYALQSYDALRKGDEQRAYQLIKKSKLLSQIAFVIGFLLMVLAAILIMVSFMS